MIHRLTLDGHTYKYTSISLHDFCQAMQHVVDLLLGEKLSDMFSQGSQSETWNAVQVKSGMVLMLLLCNTAVAHVVCLWVWLLLL